MTTLIDDRPLATPGIPALAAELAELLGLERHEVGPDTRLGELAIDSLGLLLLAAWLDERGVHIDDPSELAASSPRLLAPRLDHRSASRPDATTPLVALCAARVVLRTATPNDRDLLTELAHGDVAPVWLAGGGTLAEEDPLAALFSRALTHRVVSPRASPTQPIGHLIAYDADPRAGVVKVGAALRSPHAWPGYGAAAALRFADQLFRGWPLRKVVLETPAHVAHTFLSELELWCELEGRQREHVWIDGTHQDLLLWSCTRQQCMELLSHPPARLLARRSSEVRHSVDQDPTGNPPAETASDGTTSVEAS